MSRPDSLLTLARAESRRALGDRWLVLTGLLTPVLTAGLAYLIIVAATSEPGSGPVRIETTQALSSSSSDADVAAAVASSLILLLPLAGAAMGALAAGSEVARHGLAWVALASRRLGQVVAVRGALLLVVALVVGALAALGTTLGAALGLRTVGLLPPLSATAGLTGHLMQGCALSLFFSTLTMALVLLLRRSLPVVLAVLLLVAVLEPTAAGFWPDLSPWLPRAAAASWEGSLSTTTYLLPSLIMVLALLGLAVLATRNHRAVR